MASVLEYGVDEASGCIRTWFGIGLVSSVYIARDASPYPTFCYTHLASNVPHILTHNHRMAVKRLGSPWLRPIIAQQVSQPEWQPSYV